MLGLTVNDSKEQIVSTIDKNNFTEEVFDKLVAIARLQYLIKTADFDESVIDFGEELKANWWNENRNEILGRIGKC